MHVDGLSIGIEETDADLFEVVGSWEDDFVGEDGVAVVVENAVQPGFQEDFGETLDIGVVGHVFDGVEIVNGEEEVVVGLGAEEGFAHQRNPLVAVIGEAELVAESEVVGAGFEVRKTYAEGQGWRGGRGGEKGGWRGGADEGDGGAARNGVEGDMEDDSIGVGDGGELGLYRGNQ